MMMMVVVVVTFNGVKYGVSFAIFADNQVIICPS